MKKWLTLTILAVLAFACVIPAKATVVKCTVAIGSGGGECCTAYYCSDGTSGGSCSACNIAYLTSTPLTLTENSVAELAGMEPLTLNNRSLHLRWSSLQVSATEAESEPSIHQSDKSRQ